MTLFAKKLIISGWLMALCALYPAATPALATPLAFFPLQDISQGRNGINLSFSRYLSERIETSGTDIFSIDTSISFMANNRIRNAGELETFYINRAREELGVTYVLFGTVIQNMETPVLSLGVILNLVRTYDGRTVWTYSRTFSSADFRKLLEIGQPKSIEDLQIVLGNDIINQWPGNKLKHEELITASIDSFVLRPQSVMPGSEIYSSVHLRNLWLEAQAPRAFFKVEEKTYEASSVPRGNTFEASWMVGEKDGRFPVTLVLEWPLYGRTETFQIGSYVVDGTAPLISLDLKGDSIMQDGIPLFKDEVIIVPHRLIRKPIDHWHLTFQDQQGMVVATQKGRGDLPPALVWHGANIYGRGNVTGKYQVSLEVWDKTGNAASASSEFAMHNTLPVGTVLAKRSGRNLTVDINRKTDGKIPLAFWRLEMWSDKGKLLKTAEGNELPAQIGVEVPTSEEFQDVEGRLVIQDILGNKAKQQLSKLLDLSEPEKTTEEVVEEPSTTKSWVEEF